MALFKTKYFTKNAQKALILSKNVNNKIFFEYAKSKNKDIEKIAQCLK